MPDRERGRNDTAFISKVKTRIGKEKKDLPSGVGRRRRVVFSNLNIIRTATSIWKQVATERSTCCRNSERAASVPIFSTDFGRIRSSSALRRDDEDVSLKPQGTEERFPWERFYP